MRAWVKVLAGAIAIAATQLALAQGAASGGAAPRAAAPAASGPVGAELSDRPAGASRWSAELEQLDEDVRLRLLAPTDAASHFVRAALDKTDIASQVTHFAAARTMAPQEKLYLAALAGACLTPTQPTLPDCDAMDRLADWARRDEDNGVPSILLANRARQRGDSEQMLGHLADAAQKPRFDDYSARGVLVFWDWFRALPLAFDPAAKAEAALGYGAAQPQPWLAAMQGVCANARERQKEALRSACVDLGTALAGRSGTWLGHEAGVAVAMANATPTEQPRIQATAAEASRAHARCDDLRRAQFQGLESADAAVRSRDLAAADAWVRARASAGDVGACERLGRAPS